MRNHRRLSVVIAISCLVVVTASSAAQKKPAPKAARSETAAIVADQVNSTSQPALPAQPESGAQPATGARKATSPAPAATGAERAAILRAEILLDRARFSPGEMDAKWGQNVETALRGFQSNRGLSVSGQLDEATWAALNADSAPALIEYTVTEADAAGPFHPVPADMMAKAKLKDLGYASAAEALGEKFHSSPQLLAELNPGRSLGRAGEKILVPNVENAPLAHAAKVVVDESDATVSVVDESGKTYAQFPATMGSEHDPLPIGDWKVTVIQQNPKFHYNPDLFWDAKAKDSKATIPPSPNNPVGVVW